MSVLKDKKLYILDHWYAINHAEYCIVVESEKTITEMIEIVTAVTFLFEDVVDVSEEFSNDCLLIVLETYYDAKNRKSDISALTLKHLKPLEDIYNFYVIEDEKISAEAYHIDLYEARDRQVRENKCDEIKKKWLPKGKQLKELEELLRKEGIER